MTLEQTPCGLDFGNGWIKIALDGKASKVPNWFIESEPKGQLTKNMITSVPKAFPLMTPNGLRYFGQDTLSQSGHQKIDADKYRLDYINLLFRAVLWHWVNQHRVNPEWLSDKRLNIVCGMPPEQYQDRSDQSKALKAYKPTFNEQRPQYIKIPDKPSVPFFTSFEGLSPETIGWRSTNTVDLGWTLICDLGFGTSDIVLFTSEKELPFDTKSLPNGLMHSHDKTNSTMPWLPELDTMRKTSNPDLYVSVTKGKIAKVARQINLARLVVFGGGIRLFSKDDIASLKTYATHYTQGDEFTNVRIFEKLAGKGKNEMS